MGTGLYAGRAADSVVCDSPKICAMGTCTMLVLKATGECLAGEAHLPAYVSSGYDAWGQGLMIGTWGDEGDEGFHSNTFATIFAGHAGDRA